MKKFILFLFLSFLFVSCSDNKADDNIVYCTDEMRMIGVGVKHKDGSPYVLDSVKSFIATKEGLKNVSVFKDFNDTFFQYCQKQGTYLFVGDGFDRHFPDFVKPTKWNETKFIGEVDFVGYKKDKELFRKTIKVYTDACHVFCDEKDLAIIYLE
ncbi:MULTISPECIES: hypothetical protein [Dysgonomonas]|uniref:hypothetical protein n=1 Tax=Dysgonomonas TaxID=156973 RepID=UPI000927700B|nr:MULTISPECIES: hypothetical protein [Dysgonomonas]MBN9302371.1 hypothetical protein [Dysgonomonas mossii]OJX64288.1 MAG: hypothetical protein BGO84_09500 [Dysgonomonas sp. 37-18]